MSVNATCIDVFLGHLTGDPSVRVLPHEPVLNSVSSILQNWMSPNWPWPGARSRLMAMAPHLGAWLDKTYTRWVANGCKPGFGLRAPEQWPETVGEAWGLNRPPSPGACLAGFLTPDARHRATYIKSDVLAPLDWAIFKLFCWGYGVYPMSYDLGMPQNSVPLRAGMVAAVKALMHRPDFVCWALNPDPMSLPEPLGSRWYDRHKDWYLGQLAIRMPYMPADQRVQQLSFKEHTWPCPATLKGQPVWTPPTYERPTRPRERLKKVTLNRALVETFPLPASSLPVPKKPRRSSKKRGGARSRRTKSKSSTSTSREASSTAASDPSAQTP